MNDGFFKERARAVRAIANTADPFTKKRLLDLADKYDDKLMPSLRERLQRLGPTLRPASQHS